MGTNPLRKAGEAMNPDPKPKSVRNPKYLLWLRNQQCVNCGRYKSALMDIVPMHHGGGMAIKGDDSKALPGCTQCHAREHREGYALFWGSIWNRYGLTRDDLCTESFERYQKEMK